MGKGAPTAMSQRWPGLPCSGFNPAPVITGVVGLAAGVCVTVTGLGKVALGVMFTGEAGVLVTAAGLLSNGAPTAISQRCPGLPCSGFRPFPVATGVVLTVAGAGIETGV